MHGFHRILQIRRWWVKAPVTISFSSSRSDGFWVCVVGRYCVSEAVDRADGIGFEDGSSGDWLVRRPGMGSQCTGMVTRRFNIVCICS
jgi:hypothetical protein